MSLTNYPNGISSYGIPVTGSLPLTLGAAGVGKIYFVDATNGSDGNTGLSPDQALKTVNQAYSLVTSNNQDIIVLSTNSTHTLSAPLTITKNRLTIIGADFVGRVVQQAAKISTSSTESSAAHVMKNTGVRNTFINLKFIQSSTNAAALEVVRDGSEGAYYQNCSFVFGVVDNLNQTNAYEFVAGTDSMTMRDCLIGTETLLTSAARSVFYIDQVTTSQEFKSNLIKDTIFLISSSSATADMVHVSANTDVLFTNLFDNCRFMASLDSAGGAAVTNAVTSAVSLVKGVLNFANPVAFGFTNFCAGTTAHVQTYGPVTSAQAGEAGTPL